MRVLSRQYANSPGLSRMVTMALTSRERVFAELGVVTLVALVAGAYGLFAPPDVPLGARLALTLALSIAAWALVRILSIVGAATAQLLGLNSLWGYGIAIPVSSALIAWAGLAFAGGREAAFGEEFASVWSQTLLIGVGFFLLFFLLYWRSAPEGHSQAVGDQKSDPPAADDTVTVGVEASALHGHLRPGFPPILALSVEDHYVHAIAADRTEMLLLPLAEAIKLMPEGSGERVHRSWWVARNAVASKHREGRDLRLRLHGGLEVPVSRALAKKLRDAGLF
ncbi:LytTR family transcriptional regulator [Qipengyuania flava]|nr:LytTR family transcriptional regulator [Qipengyuania flava]